MRSTESGIRDFMSNGSWLDIKDIINGRIKSVRDILENESNIDVIKFHQGSINELRVFLDLPDIILEELIDNKGVKDGK